MKIKYFALPVLILIFTSCSVQKLAVEGLADTLSTPTGSTVFTGDNDPQLIADALPFTLKLYESLLENTPDHTALLLTAGSGFIMYANAFIQTPASMLPQEEYLQQQMMMNRARNMYLRGRDYCIRSLDTVYPGFSRALEDETYPDFLNKMTKDDVPPLYWTAAGWYAAISIDVFRISLTIEAEKPAAILARARELDPDFNQGAIDEFYLLLYASMPPDASGKWESKARDHFDRAVSLSEGRNASPFVSLASSLSIRNQNPEEFKKLLHQALEIDPDEAPENRLVNIIVQNKAQWYLEHIDDFFLFLPESEEVQP